MQQIILHLKTGETVLENVPAPVVRPGHLLIQTSRTLVSLGTERMLVEFGQAGLIEKARQQPDKVRMVLDKIRSDGLLPTLEAVFNKLGQPLPLGYCNAGRVIAVGAGVTGYQVGDRVASNGPHAEIVCVPTNLCARIPAGVSDDAAAFTVIGAVGLQGVRLLQPGFGETTVVIGLGLLGLLAAQILKANGCRVIGFDPDQGKVDLAASLGVLALNPAGGTDPVQSVQALTGGAGADAVLITASAKDNGIISQAARMSRKRGRIVLVGVIGLELSRADFYEKELSFQVSCSYGPGRYDEEYERRGHDYPIGFVRWTEQRNFEAILAALESGQLKVEPLIGERVPLADYQRIYGGIGNSSRIASLLVYQDAVDSRPVVSLPSSGYLQKGRGVIGVIGAGNFTGSTVLPALKPLEARLKYIVSAGGVTACALAKKGGFARAATDYREVLADSEVDLVIITTRHNLHASLVVEALQAGKHVFVEKPLCLSERELAEIEAAYRAAADPERPPHLAVGFNRRFAPLARRMKSLLGPQPVNIVATMNAGFLPANVWVHDLEVGGGRIVGEACHFIDLCSYLAGSRVVAVCGNALGAPRDNTDNASILLRYANGSNAVINYFANGNKGYAKERIEVHCQERSLVLDNWRHLAGFGFRGFSSQRSRQDKGHAEQFRLLVDRLKHGGEPLIPFEEIVNTTRASFAALASLKEGRWVEL